MKYAEALTNLHKSGINRNSTPQEIAAASVGTTIDKNGRPNISSVPQGQSYGNALKNMTSNPKPNVNKNLSGANSNTNITNNKTATAEANPVKAKTTENNKTIHATNLNKSYNIDRNKAKTAVAVLAAQNTKLKIDPTGKLISNNPVDKKKFWNEYSRLMRNGDKIMAAAAGISVDRNGNPIWRNKYEKTNYDRAHEVLFGNGSKKAFEVAPYEPKVCVDVNNAYGLTKNQQEKNAEYIYDYLSEKGWTKEAICGLLGNMQQESSLNPCAWQNNNKTINDSTVGYGLVQWTPASKFTNTTGATTVADIDSIANDPERLTQMQLDFIISSCQPGNGEWLPSMGVSTYGSPYKMSFDDFTNSNNDPGDLALVFHGHYERSADNEETRNNRANYANAWYDYFSDK